MKSRNRLNEWGGEVIHTRHWLQFVRYGYVHSTRSLLSPLRLLLHELHPVNQRQSQVSFSLTHGLSLSHLPVAHQLPRPERDYYSSAEKRESSLRSCACNREYQVNLKSHISSLPRLRSGSIQQDLQHESTRCETNGSLSTNRCSHSHRGSLEATHMLI